MNLKEEAKRLHDIGFAVHWLRPKSKIPLLGGWTSGGRSPWDMLEKQFTDNLNVGVRLGKASKMDDGFLAVVDCDVKSPEEKHKREVLEKLKELKIPPTAPKVLSGRGNGSRHIYIKTKIPLAPFRFSQSPDKVKVKMPSVKPSASDEKSLITAELLEGYRMRPAWEISVMGEGQQVVLPPSLHPDTGAKYLWTSEVDSPENIPLVEIESPNAGAMAEAIAAAEIISGKFTEKRVDLISSNLSERIKNLIVFGEDCDDRSAGLFSASLAMIRAGFSDDEILTVLTDREYFLGQTGYDHAQTKSRAKAAEWVRKFTLIKARVESSAAKDFEDECETIILSDEDAKKQTAEIQALGDWRAKIERAGEHAGAKPKATRQNVHLILTNEAPADVFKYNEFLGSNFYSCEAPWGGKPGEELKDIDTVLVKFWLSKHYRFEPGNDVILDTVLKIAHENKFHPVRNYLEALTWDGTPRLDNWLKTYMGAKGDDAYLRAVSRKTLCAMVARVLDPGCKFDHVLIMEGRQGCGKSTALNILSRPWFSDARLNIGDKDAVLSLKAAWIVELGELAALRRTDLDSLKQFISQNVDRVRLPYGRLTENFPRQNIFIGTTNDAEYLKDSTGNRRFWPVYVRGCDFKSLERDRNQLLAEAVSAYTFGEELFLNTVENDLAIAEQEKRTFVDEWENTLAAFLAKPADNFPTDLFTLHDLFEPWGPFSGWKETRTEQMRAGDALRHIGYQKIRAMKDGARVYLWARKNAGNRQ